MRHRVASLLITIGLAGPLPAAASEITGIPHVIDGRTIEVGGQTLRLADIETPVPGQICERGGASYDCAQEATWALAERLGRHWVLCVERDRDPQGIAQVTCYLGGRQGIDVNAHMVRRGWAVADPGSGSGRNYADAEAAAQGERLGLWAGAFDHPAQFRARQARP
jgi:endonuclease YncB( thermonuclease family)